MREGVLAGKASLVLGASRGIGAVTARALAAAGARVMLAARGVQALETVWLFSDAASFITGAVISVDGGRLAGSG